MATISEGTTVSSDQGRARSAVSMLALGLASVVVIAGCSSGGSGKSTPATSTPNPAASAPGSTSPSAPATTGAGAGCGGQKPGPGIVQQFCGGKGDAKITMGSASKELTGGTCAEQGGQFTINFGAVSGPDFPPDQTKSDYLGALVDDSSGALTSFTVVIDGVSSGVITNRMATLSPDKTGATLHGNRLSDGAAVAVAVTC